MSEEHKKKWISGFWKRIGAIFIDSLLLGIIGYMLGLLLESTFVYLGGWGRLIGFGIGFFYFGTMNSRLFDGQTIGKKLLKLRVVDSQNQAITLGRSILRYMVLATPFFLNGAHFSNEALLSFLIYPLSLIIFGGLFSILYLYIFNRVTRQSLHDLVVGTYVVNANVERQQVGKVWKFHLIIVALMFIVAAVAPAFTGKLAQREPFKTMLTAQTAISNVPGITYSTVTTNTTTYSSKKDGTKTTTSVSAQAFLASNQVNDAELAHRLATILMQKYPEASNKDVIRITLTYGYDIGIWSQWTQHSYDFNPVKLQGVK